MDITEALAPVSDQLDAIELVVPRTFTIDAGGRLGQRDNKTVAEIRFVGFPRVWRPAKSMLDVLAACWGIDGSQYVGRSITLYNDPEVMFGRDKVGGVRISHMSHIDGPRDIPVRGQGQGGRKKMWHVEPLTEATRAPKASAPTRDDIAACTDVDTLRGWADTYQGPRHDAALARIAELDAAPADDPTLDAEWGIGGDA